MSDMSDKKFINYFCIWEFSLANKIRINKDCKENLNDCEYWQGITKYNKSSLHGYLNYQKTKGYHFEKERKLLRYVQDFKCLKHYYSDKSGLNAKIINYIEGNLEDALHSPASEAVKNHNNEDIENSATVEAVREEGINAKVDGENMNIEQTIEGIQEVRDENEKIICVKSILKNSMTASDVKKAVADFFLYNFSTTKIMDLHPKSEFSLALDLDLQIEILHEIFDQINNKYITNEIHDFLITFFNKDRCAEN